MDQDRADLNSFAEFFQSTTDADKADAFVRLSPNQRAEYLYWLRSASRSDEITLKKRATLFNVERQLTALHRRLENVGR